MNLKLLMFYPFILQQNTSQFDIQKILDIAAKIGTPITAFVFLLTLVFLLFYWLKIQQIKFDFNEFKSLPDNKKSESYPKIARDLGITPERLSCLGDDRIYELISKQIESNNEKFKITAITTIVFALILSGFLLLSQFLSPSQEVNNQLTTKVNVYRDADFTNSYCTQQEKVDIAIFKDTYEFIGDIEFPNYEARARLSNNQKVTLYNLNSSNPDIALEESTKSCLDCRPYKILKWQVPIKDNKVTLRWVWINAHQENNNEGLAFYPRYKINNITANYRLPKGIKLSDEKFNTEDHNLEPDNYCNIDKENNKFGCQNLNTDKTFYFLWDWNMWNSCK